jgi:hypothetical protein
LVESLHGVRLSKSQEKADGQGARRQVSV